MGTDKALLEISGETLAARAARKLMAVCGEAAMADAGRGIVSGLPSLEDGPGKGPAAGLLGAARAHPGRSLLVLAVDLPNVPETLLQALLENPADLALPRWQSGIEPLCALYGPAALACLETRVGQGRFDLRTLAEEPGLAVRWLDGAGLRRLGDPVEMFLNLNRPGDLAALA